MCIRDSLEPVSNTAGVQALCPQVAISQSDQGVIIDFSQQRLEPVRCGPLILQRGADLTWPVSGQERVMRRSKEFDVCSLWFPCSTSRTAEYSGGLDSNHEYPLEIAVSVDQRGIQCFAVG